MTFLVYITTFINGQKKFVIENKRGFCLFFFTLFYAGYLALGGYIFMLIESPQEHLEQAKVTSVKQTILAKYPDIPEKAIDELFEQLSAVGIRGLIFGNGSVKWTYGNSVLFSMTLLTTIGYGHLSPITVFGKIMCMIYTAVGIPITLIILALYVDRLTALSNIYKANLFRRLGYQNPLCVRLLHFSTVMTFIMVGNFFLPAWVFYCLEISWSYLDSIYFCFISLTTVGLGDFVPGIAVHHPHVELYRFGATVYLLIGVTVVMFMMGLATDFWQNYNKGYHIIPMKVIPEKIPIKLDVPPSYGSIVVHTTETLDETKILIP